MSADSNAADCAFVRNKTAISLAGVPASTRRRIAAATLAASAGSSGHAVKTGAGPDAALRGQPQPRRRRHGGPGQHPVGQRHDLGGAAVAAHQADDDGVGVACREPEQEAVGRAREAVDRLSGVAHDADAVAPTEPRVEEPLLQRGDVLVLVHDEVAVAALHLARDLLVLLQKGAGEQQDVLEVAGAGRPLDRLVSPEQVGQHRRRRRGACGLPPRRRRRTRPGRRASTSPTRSHSATSRISAGESCSRAAAAPRMSSAAFDSTTRGGSPPTTCGQK